MEVTLGHLLYASLVFHAEVNIVFNHSDKKSIIWFTSWAESIYDSSHNHIL